MKTFQLTVKDNETGEVLHDLECVAVIGAAVAASEETVMDGHTVVVGRPLDVCKSLSRWRTIGEQIREAAPQIDIALKRTERDINIKSVFDHTFQELERMSEPVVKERRNNRMCKNCNS